MKFSTISYVFDLIKRKLHFYLGKINYFNALWWGIEIGKKVKFDGRCHFQRFPKTKISIGSNCSFRSRHSSNLIGINRPCIISTQSSPYNAKIEIGDNCGFSGTVIGAFKNIKIGSDVKCGSNTLITDGDWHLEDPRSSTPQDVIIGDNVWIGEGSKILKGVTIGKNSLIGAGSVVTKSIPENVIAAGNPCTVIKKM